MPASLTAGTANLMGTAMFAVFVLFAQEILEVDDVGYGLILAATGIGGIIGNGDTESFGQLFFSKGALIKELFHQPLIIFSGGFHEGIVHFLSASDL